MRAILTSLLIDLDLLLIIGEDEGLVSYVLVSSELQAFWAARAKDARVLAKGMASGIGNITQMRVLTALECGIHGGQCLCCATFPCNAGGVGCGGETYLSGAFILSVATRESPDKR